MNLTHITTPSTLPAPALGYVPFDPAAGGNTTLLPERFANETWSTLAATAASRSNDTFRMARVDRDMFMESSIADVMAAYVDEHLANPDANTMSLTHSAYQVWKRNGRAEDAQTLRGIRRKMDAFFKAYRELLQSAFSAAPQAQDALTKAGDALARNALDLALMHKDPMEAISGQTAATLIDRARQLTEQQETALFQSQLSNFYRKASTEFVGGNLNSTGTAVRKFHLGDVVLPTGPANITHVLRHLPAGELSTDAPRPVGSEFMIRREGDVTYPTMPNPARLRSLAHYGADNALERIDLVRRGDRLWARFGNREWKPIGTTSDEHEQLKKDAYLKFCKWHFMHVFPSRTYWNRMGSEGY